MLLIINIIYIIIIIIIIIFIFKNYAYICHVETFCELSVWGLYAIKQPEFQYHFIYFSAIHGKVWDIKICQLL